jgi:predicted RNase H-like HicB family nuclease
MSHERKRKVKAVFEREPDGWWIAYVPSVPGCHTQGRTLAQARERIKESVAVSLDDPVPVLLQEVRLPKKIEGVLLTLKAARVKADDAEAKANEASKRAARLLDEWGVSLRDAGELLGLSHQRVAQILEGKRSKAEETRR